ncbi:HPr(Ser) kinase/phosphatase [Fodinibius salsisoli]|uniref:HPr kinase/phosphorylase n=1 Tax=Fodinibius salsisoli TaxID=2820877 RepID=A0ABT3PNI1_9BACT|nr:HPr(Ser) kinase/phosphatase [Fodinibius salsisoli]MCW9707413.1 HPr kinase/phosphorylase [Fodinibius salsisoli]
MPFGNIDAIPRNDKLSVAYIIERLRKSVQIELNAFVTERNLDQRYVTEADLHRPGLALAGFVKLFTHQRIQVFGNTESRYLKSLSPREQEEAFQNLVQFDIPVLFLTHGNTLPQHLLDMAEEAEIPIYGTPIESSPFLQMLRDFIEDQFALQTMVHGSMVDVYGIGILIAGQSGIGKSEVALDLVERGHRLVSDDAVILTKKNNILMTSATEMNKHFMEIRGLGIIDIMSMFGVRAIRYQKRLEVVLELSLWDEESQDIERTGLNREVTNIMGIDIPLINLPITPGKNITVIAEVIAMNYLLRHYGYDAAEAFQEKVKRHIAEKKQTGAMPEQAVDYFEGDIE